MKKEKINSLTNISRAIIMIAVADFAILVSSYKFLDLDVFNRYFYAYFIVAVILSNLGLLVIDIVAKANANKKSKANIILDGLKKVSKISLVAFLLILVCSNPLAKLLSPGDSKNLAEAISIFSLSVLTVPTLRLIYMSLAKTKENQYNLYLIEKLMILVVLLLVTLLKGDKSLGEDFYLFVLTTVWIMAPLSLFLIIRSRPKKKREIKTIANEEVYLFEKTKNISLLSMYLSLFVIIDFALISFTLRILKYNQMFIDEVLFAFSTSAFKLAIVIMILVVSFIYKNIISLKEDLASGNKEGVKEGIDLIIRKVLYAVLPLSLLMSLLSKEVWMMLFKLEGFGGSVLAIFSFMIMTNALALASMIILLVTGDKVTIKKSLKISLLIKILSIYFIINSFLEIGFSAYFAIITSSIIAQLIIIAINMNFLSKKYKFNSERTARLLFDNIFVGIIISILIITLKFFIRLDKFPSLSVVLLITFITLAVYLFITNKGGLQKTLSRRR